MSKIVVKDVDNAIDLGFPLPSEPEYRAAEIDRLKRLQTAEETQGSNLKTYSKILSSVGNVGRNAFQRGGYFVFRQQGTLRPLTHFNAPFAGIFLYVQSVLDMNPMAVYTKTILKKYIDFSMLIYLTLLGLYLSYGLNQERVREFQISKKEYLEALNAFYILKAKNAVIHDVMESPEMTEKVSNQLIKLVQIPGI